jgi:signal transduction histidine kinase
MTQDEYQRWQARKNFFAGAYVSFLLVIVLLGISIYLVQRELCILLYAAYAAAILLTYLSVSGYFYEYVLPEHPQYHEYLMMQFATLAVLTGFQFARSFLRLAKCSPVFDRVFGWIMTLNLMMALFCHFLPTLIYKRFLTFSLSGLVIVTLAAALISYRRGFEPARFYICGRVLMCILGLTYTLSSENILPVNWLTMNALLLRSMGDLVFITMAILHYFYVTHQQVDSLVSDLAREVAERTMANGALTGEIEERLRLEREVVKIGDMERSSISRQLHDGLCQQLAGIRIHFAALEDQVAGSSKAGGALTARLPYIGKLLDDAVEHTYDLSRGLWSSDSDGKGTIPDLRVLVKELAAFGDVPIEIEQHHDCISCGGESLIQSHYIAREAVTNALKHANATCIAVVLHCDPEVGIFLKVTDNGRGMTSKEKSTIGGGMGIGIMKHRAIMMGGNIAITEEEAGGTTVICTAPCCGRFTKESEHE